MIMWVLSMTLTRTGPVLNNESFKVEYMFDENWNPVDLANRPTQMLLIRMPFPVSKGDMLRKVSRL